MIDALLHRSQVSVRSDPVGKSTFAQCEVGGEISLQVHNSVLQYVSICEF